MFSLLLLNVTIQRCCQNAEKIYYNHSMRLFMPLTHQTIIMMACIMMACSSFLKDK